MLTTNLSQAKIETAFGAWGTVCRTCSLTVLLKYGCTPPLHIKSPVKNSFGRENPIPIS